MLLADQAPSPDNIIWENIYINPVSKYLRRALSILITIILLVLTFVLIVYLRNVEDNIIAEYPTVDCGLS